MDILRFTSNPKIIIHECAIIKLDSWWQNYTWKDPYWRFYYNNTNNSSLLINGTRHYLQNNTVYLIPPNLEFRGELNGPVTHFYIHFHMEGNFCPIAHKLIEINLKPNLKSIISKLSYDLTNSTVPKAKMIFLTQQLILAAMIEFPDNYYQNKLIDPRITKINNHISKNISRKILNFELAQMVQMETTSFVRFFKRSTGLSPQEYIMEKKIEKACLMLHFSTMSIEEIALKMGFCDRYHFSCFFKKIRLISPARFRKNHLHSAVNITEFPELNGDSS